jgi:Fur family transcriptional regulator, ferric uptake regulator
MAAPRRVTPQQRLVSQALGRHGGFVSAQGLYGDLRAGNEPVGLATVYRSLAGMVDDGSADVIVTPTGESLYRLCSDAHHHHLVCRMCGRTVEIVSPAVERWSSKVAAEHGYADVEHTLQLSGVCGPCQHARAN